MSSGTQAHLVDSGLGPLYDGALHLLSSPSDLLGLAALALLASLRGAMAARFTVIALPIAWLLAGLVGRTQPVAVDIHWLSTVSLLLLGLLVAADAKLHPIVVLVLATIFGAFHGFINGMSLTSVSAATTALFGVVLTALFLTLLITTSVASLHHLWMRVVIRIAGSWVAAVGLLMLGRLMQEPGG